MQKADFVSHEHGCREHLDLLDPKPQARALPIITGSVDHSFGEKIGEKKGDSVERR